MKKQSGFTLIELMVVMAIIAILATAGLSAYTGYIKKSRDTVRIADLAAINTIAIGHMTSTGLAPLTVADLKTAMTAANNGIIIKDPLTSGTTAKSTCTGVAVSNQPCNYMYKVCDNGAGFNVAARFESTANDSLYLSDSAGDAVATTVQTSLVLPSPVTGGASLYEVGNCTTTPSYVTAAPATNDIIDDN